jgi:hypothetical protein
MRAGEVGTVTEVSSLGCCCVAAVCAFLLEYLVDVSELLDAEREMVIRQQVVNGSGAFLIGNLLF